MGDLKMEVMLALAAAWRSGSSMHTLLVSLIVSSRR
jgi:hypothetical protein